MQLVTFVLLFCSTFALCSSGVIHIPEQHKDYYAYPQYKFSYGVKDPVTGDNKSQFEQRDGGSVKGFYMVADPDGTLRTVHYTADDHSGFNAHVERSGKAVHPQVYAKEPLHGTISVFAAEPLEHH